MKIFKIILISSIVLLACKSVEKTAQNNLTIYCVGDSTMATKVNPDKNPEYGWAQVLPEFLKSDIKIENAAKNGRSTKSFIDEKRWDSVYVKLKKGDYVFIEFGHNDEKKEDPKCFTEPYTTYKTNLEKFVKESRSKGAIPVLFTSIVRRDFDESGKIKYTHGNYTVVTLLVAKELNVPMVDMENLTKKLEESYGVEGSKKLHLHYAIGEDPYYPKGHNDDTHLSKLGAMKVAGLAVNALKKEVPVLNKFIK
ncbi:rhamnogalacturonan acetylesterase [Halpernia frigidisoli]|uniref:Lysophospholipase L1 n=1 Tax=Halpernia frigidisoli TaxID=1125876 RepID=A0A1I3IVG2_9FLAO|nr:rhamnogalacturonan acetylesterase [Halpernia frigidisoli]SFI51954.1 Lysophospholipase L1 [Halpernia frigidisoli]